MCVCVCVCIIKTKVPRGQKSTRPVGRAYNIPTADLPTATHIAYLVRYFGCEYADTLIRMNYTQNYNFVYKF